MRSLTAKLLCVLGLFAAAGCEGALELKEDLSEVVVPPGLVIVPHPEWARPTLESPNFGFITPVWNSVRVVASAPNGVTGVLFKSPTGRMVFDTVRPFSVRFDSTKLPNGPTQVAAWATEADPEHHFAEDGGVTQHFGPGVTWQFQVNNAQHPDNPCPHTIQTRKNDCGNLEAQHVDEVFSHDGVDISYVIEGPVSDTTAQIKRHSDFPGGQAKFLIMVPGEGRIANLRLNARGTLRHHQHTATGSLKGPDGFEMPINVHGLGSSSQFTTNAQENLSAFFGRPAKGKWTLKLQTPQGGRLNHFSLRFVTDCVFEP